MWAFMSSYHSSELAKRYARALFELARDEKLLDKIQQNLYDIHTQIESHSDLAFVFSSLQFSRKEQEAVALQIAKKLKVHPLVERLIVVLARYRRLAAFQDVMRAYRDMVYAHENKMIVYLTSATEISEKVSHTLEKKLGEHYKSKVELEHDTDPSILGGIIMRIGSKMWDASTNNQLIRLAQTTKHALAKTLNQAG